MKQPLVLRSIGLGTNLNPEKSNHSGRYGLYRRYESCVTCEILKVLRTKDRNVTLLLLL